MTAAADFLGAAALPAAWRGRSDYVVVDSRFGSGMRFLQTWAAWRDDSLRCTRLWYLAFDNRLCCADEWLARHADAVPAIRQAAQQLAAAWPPATRDLHSLQFEGGRVRLLLNCIDARQGLRDAIAAADLFFLDPPAAQNDGDAAAMAKSCSRLARPGAFAVSPRRCTVLQDALARAGFVDADRSSSPLAVARHAPHRPATAPAGRQSAGAVRELLVIGAGLAGASVARSLAALDLRVRVLERGAAPACETSGNPAGLFHGTVHRHDGTHARLLRAASQAAHRAIAPLVAAGRVAGATHGLLRLDRQGLAAMQATLTQQQLPADWVQALSREAACRVSEVELPCDAWFYPTGGWVAPAQLVRAWLDDPRIETTTGIETASLRHEAGRWQAVAADGQVIAEADAVVLANAADVPRLVQTAIGELPPLGSPQLQPGQLTHLPAGTEGLAVPTLPIAGNGYVIPAPPSAGGGLYCGAGTGADPAANLARAAALTGSKPRVDPQQLHGRSGWRLAVDDKLPLLGPLGAPTAESHTAPLLQPRHVPRVAGLYLYTALGSRGITWAPLLGEALAAWITGSPMPLPAGLIDAVDAARYVSRRLRET